MSKKFFKAFLLLILFVTLTSFNVSASEGDFVVSVIYDDDNIITSQYVDGEPYLFVPSFYDITKFELSVNGYDSFVLEGNRGAVTIEDGVKFNLLTVASPEDYIYNVTVYYGNESKTIKIMKSYNISTVLIESDNPVDFGMSYVNSVFGNESSGKIAVIDKNNYVIYDGELKAIKGRGNSTWEGSEKKPYQIKLAEKANLLNDNNSDNINKTWILLANSYDPTLIRNRITYDLSAEIGMEFYPESIPVDFYYDKVYIGSYVLSEKNEISNGRIDIYNLEDEIEELNGDYDPEFDYGTNKYGNKFKFTKNIVMPEHYDNGFLFEYEYPDRADLEDCWFSTTNGNYIVIKSPERLPEDVVRLLSEYYQEYEDAVYNKGINPSNGRSFKEYTDFDSLVKMFAVEQFTKDIDAFVSSTYMYLDNDNIFKYGPVWDFDIAYGIGSNLEADENQKASGFTVFNTDMCKKLMSITEFSKSFTTFYNDVIVNLVDNVLLGNEQGAVLDNMKNYIDIIYSSELMNNKLWGYNGFNGSKVDWVSDNYTENVDYLKHYIKTRNDWIQTAINDIDVMNGIDNINIYTYYDEVRDEIYVSLGEKDYITLKILNADNDNIVIKHLSGIEYSPDMKVYVNGNLTEYYFGDLESVIIPMPENHNIMPSLNTNIKFKDVAENSWYKEYVYNAYRRGWMKGVTEKRFQPDEYLKRGMIITALFRQSGGESSKIKYTISSECYNDAAEWAIDNDIIYLYEKDHIDFSEFITREEAAVLFYRAAGSQKTEQNLHFNDSYNIDKYNYDAVKWCVKNGILAGDHKNRLLPDKYLTRAEFTKMLSVYSELF